MTLGGSPHIHVWENTTFTGNIYTYCNTFFFGNENRNKNSYATAYPTNIIEGSFGNYSTRTISMATYGVIIFKGNIDETAVDQLRIGMEAKVTIGAKPDETLMATLEYIAPEGTEQNGAKVFEIRAGVKVPNGVKIRSGYSANADIVLAEVKDALAIDESAIVFEDQKPYVYQLTSKESDEENQQFKRLPVELGISDGLFVAIKSGVDKSMKLRGRKK